MKPSTRPLLAGLSIVCALAAMANAFGVKPPVKPKSKPAAPVAVSFAKIQPVIKAKCVGCHNGPTGRAGVNLTSYESITTGKFKGKALVVPKKPGSSVIVSALHGTGVAQMPPGHALPADEIKAVENWILTGAKK